MGRDESVERRRARLLLVLLVLPAWVVGLVVSARLTPPAGGVGGDWIERYAALEPTLAGAHEALFLVEPGREGALRAFRARLQLAPRTLRVRAFPRPPFPVRVDFERPAEAGLLVGQRYSRLDAALLAANSSVPDWLRAIVASADPGLPIVLDLSLETRLEPVVDLLVSAAPESRSPPAVHRFGDGLAVVILEGPE